MVYVLKVTEQKNITIKNHEKLTHNIDQLKTLQRAVLFINCARALKTQCYDE